MSEGYLTVAEMAGLFHVSTATIERWNRAGRLPVPVRMGKKLLFPTEEVRQQMERLRTGAASVAS
jgi:excisionase family DNA binding protein